MSNTNRMTNRVLSLLCLSALLTAGGCALVENVPFVSPLAAWHQPQHGSACGCQVEGIGCYGYHPTQWYPWPAWCESASIPCTGEALYEVEVVPAGEPTLAPQDEQPGDRDGRPEVPEQTVPPPAAEPPDRSPGSDFAAGADGIGHGSLLP